MASSPGNAILSHFLLINLLLISFRRAFGCYDAIFSFGDSVIDTGNLIHLDPGPVRAGRPPYGVTYFHRPSGRCSDGRLIIDFIAQDLGLPLVPPYFGGNRSEKFEYGANFAVIGANAMKNEFFHQAGIEVTWKDYSLVKQLQWFKQFLLESSREIFGNSLFMISEIGVNDYYHFLDCGAVEELPTLAPVVIHQISSAITELIELGARTVMVAGLFPFGCTSKIMAMFQSEDINQYDLETGCIKWINHIAEHHNDLLKIQLDKLMQLHPHANIIYADYYKSAIPAYEFPEHFGLNVTLVACCGGGGQYNFNAATVCSEAGSTLCQDPSSYVSWDGVHLTESAHRIMAEGLLKGGYTNPPLAQTCLRHHSSKALYLNSNDA